MKNTLHVVITGASSGIGLALVKQYLVIGYKISCCARNIEGLLQEFGSNPMAFCANADVSIEADCKQFIEQAIAEFNQESLEQEAWDEELEKQYVEELVPELFVTPEESVEEVVVDEEPVYQSETKEVDQINEIVEVEIDGKLKSVTIIDLENFGDLILYYADDGNAYTQDSLKLAGTKGLTYFLFASNEEKDKDFLSILDKLGLTMD
jgi:hypothetical protein